MKNSKEKINTEIPIKEIEKIFELIPAGKIFEIAKDIQGKLGRGQIFGQKIKSNDEWGWVTEADTGIQKLALKYFANSKLAGTYKVKAEEKFTQDKNSKGKSWQLIIDPLDGTSNFRKGGKKWGVMIGACDKNGILQYSWNLISDGKKYSSDLASKVKKILPESLLDKKTSRKKIIIDFYDYGQMGTKNSFEKIIKEKLKLQKNDYRLTSCPSAVYAGGELVKGKIDALLWIPSKLGKKWYPDYDLVFLGALAAQGFKIKLGKMFSRNVLLSVAKTEKDVNLLYQIGLEMTPENLRKKIFVSENPLQITSKIK